MANVLINARVECTDGYAGESICVIIDPTLRQVTHLVVAERRPPMTERLVAVAEVVATTPDKITLRCTTEELANMDPFVTTQYVKAQHSYQADFPCYLWPYSTAEEFGWYKQDVERISVGQLAVRRGAQVEATDGYIGRVAELMLDAETREVTHLVVRQGHLSDQQEVAIPVSHIARSQENTVYLDMDKQTAGSLPVVPVKRGEGLDELIGSLRAEWASSRDEQRGHIKDQLRALDAEIDSLKAKAAEARPDSRVELEERIAAARARRQAARAERSKELEAETARVDAQLGGFMQMLHSGLTKTAADEEPEDVQKANELRRQREQAQNEMDELNKLMEADETNAD